MFVKGFVLAGLHPLQAQAAQVVLTGLTAAGSTQGTALALTGDANFIGTAAASTGVILPSYDVGDVIYVVNGGANAVAVYPPVGHTINGLAANTALSVAVGKGSMFARVDGTRWVGVASA
jgi:hypothetical protein